MTHHRPTPAELIAAALEYAALGWHVVPLHEVTAAGGCSCGRPDCGSQGKHPRPKEWQRHASSDPARVSAWWVRTPLANVGIRCGSPSELVGIDIDPPNGEAALATVSNGDLPPTLEMLTGKGRRLLYAIPDSLEWEPRTACLQDDGGRETLRLQGGANTAGEARGYQCVLPPSWHPVGRRYEWVAGRGPSDLPPAPMPGWVMLLMSPPPEPKWVDPPAATDPELPGAQFNARADWWVDVLTPQGARPAGRAGGEVQYATRPGKAGGVSASIGYHKARDGTPALHVFSGNWPQLEAGRTYDKFGVWCRMNYRGDFAAAARAAVAGGYADPPKQGLGRAGPGKGGIEERLARVERENWELAREVAALRRVLAESDRGRQA